jgi:hypothetical protein
VYGAIQIIKPVKIRDSTIRLTPKEIGKKKQSVLTLLRTFKLDKKLLPVQKETR